MVTQELCNCPMCQSLRMEELARNTYKESAYAPMPRDVYPATKAGWLAYIKENGLEELGRGASRTCYALDSERVIKIERENAYCEQSEPEVKVWRAATTGRKYLTKVIDSGLGWTIMERATFVLAKMVDPYSMEASQVGTDIANAFHSAEGIYLSDLHPYNIGYFSDGQFKAIDYGI